MGPVPGDLRREHQRLEPSGVAVGDLDGDGALDLAVSNQGSNTVSLLLSDP